MILILNREEKLEKELKDKEREFNQKVVVIAPNVLNLNYEEVLNLNDEWTRSNNENIKPVCFCFEGINFKVSSWIEIYEIVVEYSGDKYGKDKMPYYILEKGNIRNSYVYSFSTNINKVFSANEIRDRIIDILKSYNLDKDELTVYTVKSK